MAGFFNCGFARVAAKNSVYNENGKLIRDKNTRLQKFMIIFGDNMEAFAVNQNAFDKRLPVLLRNFEKWRGETKSKYLEHFSPTAWRSLSAAKRGMHSVSNCRGCHVNHLSFQSLFPLKTNRLKGVDPMSVSLKEATTLRKVTRQFKPPKATLQETAKNIYLKINEPFKDLFDTDFAEALTKIPEIGLAHAKTKAQKKKERRDVQCKVFSKTKLKDSGPKLIVTHCLQHVSPLSRGNSRENHFTSSPRRKVNRGPKKGRHWRMLDFERRNATLQIQIEEGLLQEVNTMKEGEKVRIQFIKQ